MRACGCWRLKWGRAMQGRDDSFPLGRCFQVAHTDQADCAHPDAACFAWFARDDTVKSGQMYCVVCMACGTVLHVGETAATRGLARIRAARDKEAR
jgi:hypothetical protein